MRPIYQLTCSAIVCSGEQVARDSTFRVTWDQTDIDNSVVDQNVFIGNNDFAAEGTTFGRSSWVPPESLPVTAVTYNSGTLQNTITVGNSMPANTITYGGGSGVLTITFSSFNPLTANWNAIDSAYPFVKIFGASQSQWNTQYYITNVTSSSITIKQSSVQLSGVIPVAEQPTMSLLRLRRAIMHGFRLDPAHSFPRY